MRWFHLFGQVVAPLLSVQPAESYNSMNVRFGSILLIKSGVATFRTTLESKLRDTRTDVAP